MNNGISTKLEIYLDSISPINALILIKPSAATVPGFSCRHFAELPVGTRAETGCLPTSRLFAVEGWPTALRAYKKAPKLTYIGIRKVFELLNRVRNTI